MLIYMIKNETLSQRMSHAKNRGHEREFEFCIGLSLCDPIPGTDKADVVFNNGQTASLKGGSRLQLQSTSSTSSKLNSIDLGDLMKLCCDHSYDPSRHMRSLAQELSKRETIKTFLRQILFQSKHGEFVDYLSFKEDSIPVWHIFFREDVIDVLTDQLKVCTSKARSWNQVDDQKVILKGVADPIKNRSINIIENEVRNKTSNPTFICTAHKNPLLSLLKNNFDRIKLLKDSSAIRLIGYGNDISDTLF